MQMLPFKSGWRKAESGGRSACRGSVEKDTHDMIQFNVAEDEDEEGRQDEGL